MTILQQLHNSKFHREGFDPACPQCLKDEGISGIIDHLAKCAPQNDADGAFEVAAEQRRMSAILKLYRMHCHKREVA